METPKDDDGIQVIEFKPNENNLDKIEFKPNENNSTESKGIEFKVNENNPDKEPSGDLQAPVVAARGQEAPLLDSLDK